MESTPARRQATKDVATETHEGPCPECGAETYHLTSCSRLWSGEGGNLWDKPRVAAIHRASVPAEPTTGHCEKCGGCDGDHYSPCIPATEAPERIYLPADTDADDWRILAKNPSRDWSTGKSANLLEYILRSSHEAEVSKLRDALKATAPRMFESGLCWCDIPCPELGEHTSACAAARDAVKGE